MLTPSVVEKRISPIFVSVSSTALMVLFCAMSGYAFARIEFPGRELLFYAYLATLMVPQQVTLRVAR